MEASSKFNGPELFQRRCEYGSLAMALNKPPLNSKRLFKELNTELFQIRIEETLWLDKTQITLFYLVTLTW